jgi:hypothetical protein
MGSNFIRTRHKVSIEIETFKIILMAYDKDVPLPMEMIILLTYSI